jgi:hypothetical protein
MTLAYVLAEADRVFRRCRREFVAAFAGRLAALGVPAVPVGRGTGLVWSCAGRDGWASLAALDRPAKDDPGRPLVLRASVGRPPLPAATFTALPDEVVALAPWVAEWLVSSLLPRRRLPASPIPLRGCGGDRGRLRAAGEEWTQRAYEAHGCVLRGAALARKRRLGLASDPAFELCLCRCATEAERLTTMMVYADWLEERGHIFEAVCFRAGTDPADVLTGRGQAWGLALGAFGDERLPLALLDRLGDLERGRRYRSAAEAKEAFVAAWGGPATGCLAGDRTAPGQNLEYKA